MPREIRAGSVTGPTVLVRDAVGRRWVDPLRVNGQRVVGLQRGSERLSAISLSALDRSFRALRAVFEPGSLRCHSWPGIAARYAAGDGGQPTLLRTTFVPVALERLSR